jgi:hypothetical protein
MKSGPLNPFAIRKPLVAGTPLDLQVVAGLPYILAIRGTFTGSSVVVKSFLGTSSDIEEIDEDAGGVIIDGFTDPTAAVELPIQTTGNWIRIERTLDDPAPDPVPDLIVSLIDAQAGGAK